MKELIKKLSENYKNVIGINAEFEGCDLISLKFVFFNGYYIEIFAEDNKLKLTSPKVIKV